jgi:hypothetical protein
MSFLHRKWPVVVVFLLSFSISLALVYRYYKIWGINDSLGLCALLIAIGTLIVTIFSLRYTRRSLEFTEKSFELTSIDIKNRVRPFVSVGTIDGDAFPSPQHTPPLTLVSVCFHVQNTGLVPAVKLDIEIVLKHSNSAEIVKRRNFSIPALPPNDSSLCLDFNVPQDADSQQLIRTGVLNTQISINYEALGLSHKSLQTYSIKTGIVLMGDNKIAEVYYEPIDPTVFS